MRKISVVFHPASGPAVDQGADRVPAFESRVDIGFRNLYLKDMYLDRSVCRLDYLHLLLFLLAPASSQRPKVKHKDKKIVVC